MFLRPQALHPQSMRPRFRAGLPTTRNAWWFSPQMSKPVQSGERSSSVKLSFLKIGWGVTAVALLAFVPAVARAGQVVEVHVTSNVFTPDFVLIHQGDTVRWIFDQGIHDTVSVGGEWNSGYHNPGEVFEYRFTGTGQYDYYCSIHIDCCNMMGSVYVLPKDRDRAAKAATGN